MLETRFLWEKTGFSFQLFENVERVEITHFGNVLEYVWFINRPDHFTQVFVRDGALGRIQIGARVVIADDVPWLEPFFAGDKVDEQLGSIGVWRATNDG